MKKILICWIGLTDLKAAGNVDANIGAGPICQAVRELEFDEIHLISDRPKSENKAYINWLKSKITSKIILHTKPLSSPTNFGEIYKSAVNVLDTIKEQHENEVSLTFHLSPGTPAMAAVWIIIAKTRCPAALIESSIKQGVKAVSIPFDISAEFIPDLLKKSDLRLEQWFAQFYKRYDTGFLLLIHFILDEPSIQPPGLDRFFPRGLESHIFDICWVAEINKSTGFVAFLFEKITESFMKRIKILALSHPDTIRWVCDDNLIFKGGQC